MENALPHSLPVALNRAIQSHAAKAFAQGRLFSFKILAGLPTWIADDLTEFQRALEECLSLRLEKSRPRSEMYVIGSVSRLPDGRIELEFTSTDLPGFKLSSDAKPFFTYALKPYSERETFKHLLPLENEATPEPTLGLLSGFRVLVVDDSEEALAFESRLIEKFGGHAVCARTGTEAIEKALNDHFDVVLMDIKMPRVDGNTAMKTLVDKRYRMPVIALSAFATIEERKHSLSHGFADCLSKPIVPEQLIRTIARLTNRSLPVVQWPLKTPPSTAML